MHDGSQRMPVSPTKPVNPSLFELNQECAYALRVLAGVRPRKDLYNPQPGQLTAPRIAALPGRTAERHTGLVSCGNYLCGSSAAPTVEDLEVILTVPAQSSCWITGTRKAS